MGKPEFIKKLTVRPDANREALSEFGRMGGQKRAENEQKRRAEDAAFDAHSEEAKTEEMRKMSEERGDDLIPEDDR